MSNPIIAAARAYWSARVENRAERIDRAARRLTAIAKEEKARAKDLRGKARSASSGRNRAQVTTERTSEEPSCSRPYDWVEAGAVNCPMWCDETTREFVFGLRWKLTKDGRPHYRRTVSVEMFDDVIRALADLAAKYAKEDRVPQVIRERMSEYFLFLKNVPDCVREELAKKSRSIPVINGKGQDAGKQQ